MSLTFIRKYHISVSGTTGDNNLIEAEISEHQIQCVFKYSASSTATKADGHTIRMYNIPENMLSAIRQKGIKVIVRAGYEQDSGAIYRDNESLPVIFKGEVVKSNVERTETDTILDITLSNGYTEKARGIVDSDYKKGSRIFNALLSMGETLNLPVNIELGELSNLTFDKDSSFRGPTIEVLERITKRYGLNWYIQNEEVFITNRQQPSEVATQTYLVNTARIKGTISWSIEEGFTTLNEGKGGQVPLEAADVRATFSMFLVPTLKLGDKINVTIDNSELTLTVDVLEHRLDYYGKPWDTKVEATAKVQKGLAYAII